MAEYLKEPNCKLDPSGLDGELFFDESVSDSVKSRVLKKVRDNELVLSQQELNELIEREEVSEELEMSSDTIDYICPEDSFVLDNFVTNFSGYKNAIVTDSKVSNLKNLFHNVIIPIVDFYKKKESMKNNKSCLLKIINGLVSKEVAKKVMTGNINSRHIYGEALDFNINGVQSMQVILDIITGKITDLNYGTLYLGSGGVHITLPYTFNGQLISKVYIAKDDKGNIADGDLAYLW